MRMWVSHPDCSTIVRDSWSFNVIGCPMFILTTKLKVLKEKLKIWNKDGFGNVHEVVQLAEQNLNHLKFPFSLNDS